jgi:hypothetical protein
MTREALHTQEQAEARQIGRRLRHVREQAGLTLRDLGQRLDFPHHTILLKLQPYGNFSPKTRLVFPARTVGVP